MSSIVDIALTATLIFIVVAYVLYYLAVHNHICPKCGANLEDYKPEPDKKICTNQNCRFKVGKDHNEH